MPFSKFRSLFSRLMDSIRPGLRRLCRRTPPQREAGWTHLSSRRPGREDANPQGLVEIYRPRADELFNAYFWSLGKETIRDGRDYYWRKIDRTAPPDRHLVYFERSRSILG